MNEILNAFGGYEGILIQGGFKIMLALFGIIMGRITLLWMDGHIERSNSTFAVWLKGATDDAKATYYGARFIAICLVIGFAIG